MAKVPYPLGNDYSHYDQINLVGIGWVKRPGADRPECNNPNHPFSDGRSKKKKKATWPHLEGPPIKGNPKGKWARKYENKRNRLWNRDDGFRSEGKRWATCRYCHEDFELKKLTVDHVVPVSKGGSKGDDNCVLSCWPCNNKKGDKLIP